MNTAVTIYFVRHGETDWNAARRIQGLTDTPLNARGQAQAARNGRALRDALGTAAGTLAFVASPLARTSETMRIMRGELGLEPGRFPTDPRLVEISYGDYEGRTWSELEAMAPAHMAARERDAFNWLPPGATAESYAMATRRIAGWLEEVTDDLVVVSHGGIMRCLRGLVQGLAPARVTELHVPQDKVLVLRNGEADWI